MKRYLLTRAAVVSTLLAAAAPALAKEKPAPPSPLIAAIDRCRQIADPAQRLACFDSAAGALVSATASGEVNVVDRTEVREIRRSLFGFSMPKIPFFGGDTTVNEVQAQLDSTVKSVRALNNGYYEVTIADNGATWQTSDSSVSFDPPRVGQKISIVRGPMGSYFLRINGQVGVRGRRIG